MRVLGHRQHRVARAQDEPAGRELEDEARGLVLEGAIRRRPRAHAARLGALGRVAEAHGRRRADQREQEREGGAHEPRRGREERPQTEREEPHAGQGQQGEAQRDADHREEGEGREQEHDAHGLARHVPARQQGEPEGEGSERELEPRRAVEDRHDLLGLPGEPSARCGRGQEKQRDQCVAKAIEARGPERQLGFVVLGRRRAARSHAGGLRSPRHSRQALELRDRTERNPSARTRRHDQAVPVDRTLCDPRPHGRHIHGTDLAAVG